MPPNVNRDPRPGYTYQPTPPSPSSSPSPSLSPSPSPSPTLSPSPHYFTLPSRPSPRADPSARSSDRKRRPTSTRNASDATGASRADPIVLTSSPPAMRPLPPLPPQPSHEHPGRSHIVVPTWQPDADVHQCPVCGRPFTFLQRRHHCRKCGRVVCHACSPHRITIPRQFIVHPPSDHSATTIDLTTDDDQTVTSPFGSLHNPALGGGEEVRVCNPCVPDPNPHPPPHYIPPYLAHHHALASPRPPRSSTPLPPHTRAPIFTSNIHSRPARTAGHGQTREQGAATTVSHTHRRVSYHGATFGTQERRLPPLPAPSSIHVHPSHTHPDASLSRQLTGAPSHDAYIHPYYSNTPRSATHALHRTINTPASRPFTPQHARPTRPTHQVAEEDECPICGHELPPKDAENDDADRTQHIQECIALHSASPAPVVPCTLQTSVSLPTQRTRGMSTAGDPRSGQGSSHTRHSSHAARGMVPYTATEKDCTDEDGRETECIICLEDFEAGDQMARLVCWCKFHEKCIREWWDKKGRGACPTHQLQE